MRLVTYNIQFSRGKDGCFDLARCVREVEGADIVALQEVERHWPRSGMADQPAEIGTKLPHHYWVYAPFFDTHIERDASEPAAPIDNRRRQFGNMLLSRWPILSSRQIALAKAYYDDRFNMHMGALEGVIETPRGPLRVWSIHLGYLEAAERLVQIRHLLEVQRRGPDERGAWSGPGSIQGDDWSGGTNAPPMPESTVWLGDFNSEPASEEYGLITSSESGGLLDAWPLAGHDVVDGVTYFNAGPNLDVPGWRIDYGFVTPDLSGRVKSAWVDAQAQGSDHQPLWLELAD